jgi:hypothetical protein
VGMDLKDMDWNLEEMTPEERNRIEYLVRVAKILRMPPDELIKECDEIMAPKGQPDASNSVHTSSTQEMKGPSAPSVSCSGA